MPDSLPTLLEQRKHRLTLNLTRSEADLITSLCLQQGVLNRAAVARAALRGGCWSWPSRCNRSTTRRERVRQVGA